MLDFGFYNMDCMDGMKQFSNKYFELAIVDPPYGINYDLAVSKNGGKQYGKSLAPKQTYHTANWDKAIPNKEYFDELFRVSKNQIIWGGITLLHFYRQQKVGWYGINAVMRNITMTLVIANLRGVVRGLHVFFGFFITV